MVDADEAQEQFSESFLAASQQKKEVGNEPATAHIQASTTTSAGNGEVMMTPPEPQEAPDLSSVITQVPMKCILDCGPTPPASLSIMTITISTTTTKQQHRQQHRD